MPCLCPHPGFKGLGWGTAISGTLPLLGVTVWGRGRPDATPGNGMWLVPVSSGATAGSRRQHSPRSSPFTALSAGEMSSLVSVSIFQKRKHGWMGAQGHPVGLGDIWPFHP